MSLVKEFKEFISRGNVIDMAVGVVIGAAFSAIINSLVKDVINPVIGFLLAGIDFANLKIVLKAATEATPEVAIMYGSLINSIINFILVALVIFLVIKGFNKLKKKQEVAEAAPAPAGPSEAELLSQILDELKKK